MPQCHINCLPKEMLLGIFQKLSPQDLKSVVLVCKTWLEIGEDAKLWTVIKIDSREDCQKLNIQRLRLLQEIKVTHAKKSEVAPGISTIYCHWMKCDLMELLKTIHSYSQKDSWS